jgi:DNA repair protein RecO (recombination protein O)
MSEWRSDAISLGARKFGENDAILEVFTPHKGRTSGLVYGGAGKTKRALLEPGTRLHLSWKSRAEDQLGFFDALEARGHGPAAMMDDPAALAVIAAIAALLQAATPEKSGFGSLYEATEILLEALGTTSDWPALYIRWEIGLLSELGYGLDLTKCALTGGVDDLAWVSPKTGKAATRDAGAPFADKLLVLPPFLLGGQNPPATGDVADGFALAGHFIARELLDPVHKTMPDARARLIFALGRSGRL